MTNFEIIRNDGRLLYEYIRGSHLYGLNNEYSDVDTSGVYICTKEELLGCFGYKPQVSDSRHDNTWFEIGELVRLLLKSNPTVMESLFVPEDKIIGQVHPLMQMLIDHREEFISKQCFNPFFGYAKSQIEKAKRNPKRYESNLDKTYDSKNMMHCFRLMHMAAEIAEGKGMLLQRTWDKQFLMDVRNHKFEYDEIIERLEADKEHMNRLMEQSTIREKIDTDFVNQLMIEIRKKQLKIL